MILPEDYVSQKFYQLAGYVKHKRYNNVYEGGCPICREGKSWGRKRRLYYVAKQNYIYCHKLIIIKEKFIKFLINLNVYF